LSESIFHELNFLSTKDYFSLFFTKFRLYFFFGPIIFLNQLI